MHPVFPGCKVIKKRPGGVSCPVLDRYTIANYVIKTIRVRVMNTLKAQTEETIYYELILEN